MNKTIIINISGVIFHIEEDAYEKLKSYMSDIKKHFSSYQDNFEIVSDIENRIAEMFSELLLKDSKQVIVIQDVETVTAKMGNTSDFDLDEGEEFTETTEGIPLNKKLYRDIDDRFIGGVCSGIGHYFGIEARWLRIAFFILFIFFGFGLLPYVLLWIIMPKAASRTEKMEMKGEKINLQSFQKNVEDELNAVKTNLKNAHENVKPGLGRLGIFIRTVIKGLVKFIGKALRILLKIIGTLIIITVSLALIAAFIALVIFLGYTGNTDVSNIFPLNAILESLRPAIYISSFLVIFIPLIAIILAITGFVFNRKTLAKSVNFNLLMVWIIALAVDIYCIAKNSTEFKERASYTETLDLKSNSNNIYYLQTGQERTVEENISQENGKNKIVVITGNESDFENSNRVNINLHLIKNGSPSLSKTYTAKGKNFDQALKNAHQINYYYQQKDSLITFDFHSSLKDGSLWRDQEVNIALNFPTNSTLYIQKRLARYFFRNEMYDCIDDESSSDDFIKVWVTENGFVCKKTAEAIERQKKDNEEEDVKEDVKETVVF